MSSEEEERFREHYSKTIVSLESLVRVVTVGKSDSSISVTLNVHGTLVSGKLVSTVNYHKFLRHTILDNLHQKNDREVFGPIEDAFKILETVPIMDENDTFIFNYVCIQDARIFLSGNTPTVSVPYWIGKMESVDGFFIGEIEEDPSTQSLV